MKNVFAYLSLLSFAASSTLSFAVAEDQLELSYATVIKEEITDRLEMRNFESRDQKQLFYAKVKQEAPQGVLLVIPGRTELSLKYQELAYDLRDLNLDLYFFDHRGQGQSERLTNDPMRGHVEHFQDYVNDLHDFIEQVVKAESKGPIFVVAHSMGGAIVTQYAIQNPGVITAMAFSSPMYQIDTKPFPSWTAYGIAGGASLIGKGDEFVTGQGPYDLQNDSFAKTVVTHSEARWTQYWKQLLAQPEFIIGGPTNSWIRETLETGWNLQNNGKKLKTPTLIFSADNDQLVKVDSHEKVCSKSKVCQLVKVAPAKHEVFQESDAVRNGIVEKIRAFFRVRL